MKLDDALWAPGAFQSTEPAEACYYGDEPVRSWVRLGEEVAVEAWYLKLKKSGL
jgi:hypothetical protein